jgi:hypothetical protein
MQRIIIGALHAGVQVNLTVTGSHTILNQNLGLFHGYGNGLVLPGAGSQVVAANRDLIKREALSFCQVPEIGNKLGRGPASVSPKLVHLVTGGFDKNGLPSVLCLL